MEKLSTRGSILPSVGSLPRSSSAAEARVLAVPVYSAVGRLTRSSSAAEARVLAVPVYSAVGRLTRSSSAVEARVLAVPVYLSAGRFPVAAAQRRLVVLLFDSSSMAITSTITSYESIPTCTSTPTAFTNFPQKNHVFFSATELDYLNDHQTLPLLSAENAILRIRQLLERSPTVRFSMTVFAWTI
jgi:hypothetical protein